MAKCAKCGGEMKDAAKFCPKCGAKAEARPQGRSCGKCGGPLRETAKFCPACGAACGMPATGGGTPPPPKAGPTPPPQKAGSMPPPKKSGPPPLPKMLPVNSGGIELWNGITTGMNEAAVIQRVQQIMPGAEINRDGDKGFVFYNSSEERMIITSDVALEFTAIGDCPYGLISVHIKQGKVLAVYIISSGSGPRWGEVNDALCKKYGDSTKILDFTFRLERDLWKKSGLGILLLVEIPEIFNEFWHKRDQRADLSFFDFKACVSGAIQQQKAADLKHKAEEAKRKSAIIV